MGRELAGHCACQVRPVRCWGLVQLVLLLLGLVDNLPIDSLILSLAAGHLLKLLSALNFLVNVLVVCHRVVERTAAVAELVYVPALGRLELARLAQVRRFNCFRLLMRCCYYLSVGTSGSRVL